ncbi:polysaccharide deacetylase family protein [Bowmanella denitrificans]|uniref:polysaccharide deacetylase family protein n=1 Tax=Bowmanella denitrificans TaxID=366582 RepID=UPI000C9C1F53|nr:polysaccharide deacetylase family protein [Bowmanella denitrificans]
MLHWGLSLAGRLLNRGKLSILIYHQVLAEFDPMRPNEPTVQVFDWQMALLAKYFTPLSLDQAIKGLAQDNLPANAVCVTFDDGYLNNLTLAQPILAKYNIPATVYIATAFSDGVNMWNDRVMHLFADPNRDSLLLDEDKVVLADMEQRRAEAYKRLKQLKHLDMQSRLGKVSQWYQQNLANEQAPLMMTPAEVRELAQLGITIGAHTVNHPILKVHDEPTQQWEIETSKQQLESWLDKPVEHFAYPNGVWQQDLDETTVSLAKQAGFKTAVITNWGKATGNTDFHMLPRFTPWDRQSVMFQTRLVRGG